MTGQGHSRGLAEERFLPRANELGALGTAKLAAARSAGDDIVAVLKAWVDDPVPEPGEDPAPELVDAHIQSVITDPVMEPLLLKIVDLIIELKAPFKVRLEEGTGAVAYKRDDGWTVVVVATP